VFGPLGRYPLVGPRAYTPSEAAPGDAQAMLGRLGLSRIVLVQPSPYGADNRCMLDAMEALGPGSARGVAVIDERHDAPALERLNGAGVRGVRLNIASGGNDDDQPLPERIGALARRIAPLGWHLQLFIAPPALAELERTLTKLPVAVVIDHMGLVPAAGFERDPGFAALLRLLDTGRCWVKLSGAYRLSGSDEDFESVAPLACALVQARADRLVWGSDWPHTPRHRGTPEPHGSPRPFRPIDTGRLLDLLEDWVPRADTRLAVLVDNPASLYDFT
jgi:predicted TIM-barrel fold metal-dependent hydrolase